MKILTTPRMERCIGCHSCSLACARLIHKRLSWDTAGIRIRSSGGLSTGFEASICLACDPAPCKRACPTGAYSQRKGGGVVVRKKLCIRCGACVKACPVDAIYQDATGEPFVCIHCGRCIPYCPHDCLRHSHLDAGGYAYDQKPKGKSVEDAIEFLVKDERGRVFLTSMVACLFARGVYTDEVLGNCLKSVGYGSLADNMHTIAEGIQRLRWKMRVRSGYHPENVSIPKRFTEITTWRGQIDGQFLELLKDEYGRRILELAG